MLALTMLGTHFYKGMERAGSNVEAQFLMEEPGDLAIGTPFPPQFPDQFAVRFEFGAWRFGWKAGEFDKQVRGLAGYLYK